MALWSLLLLLVCMLLSSARSMTTKTSQRVVLHWFRVGDLRVHDNPALVHSQTNGDTVVPVFCFDPNFFGDSAKTDFGSVKCGPKRAQFLLESVADLRQQLQKQCQSGLVVAHGDPATVLAGLVQKVERDAKISIVCQEEVVGEERAAVAAVRSSVQAVAPQTKLTEVWGSTMYDLKDLPYDDNLQGMPDTFTPFRNKVEKNCQISRPLPPPKSLPLPLKDTSLGQALVDGLTFLPTLESLGYTSDQIQFAKNHDDRGVMHFPGGETAALARVHDYIWTKDLLKVYFETRNGMIGADYSTKLSPWLAHGCISPRYIAAECKRYEEERVANKSTYWVVFELLWRDFCKFFAYKHGDAIFYPSGTIGKHKKWSTFEKNLKAWKEGKTGYPLVDANMRELQASGFMSNRGRQNVASFLTIDMNHDWRLGGDYFESHLIDYDVYSNWVNWCAAAGQTGGRLNRFNIVKQSKDYDANGDYVRHWLPELKNVPNQFVHEPWKMNQFQQMEYGVKLGVDYPNPILPPSKPHPDSGGKHPQGKQRRPNNGRNRKNQQYEMKSVKQGSFQMRG